MFHFGVAPLQIGLYVFISSITGFFVSLWDLLTKPDFANAGYIV